MTRIQFGFCMPADFLTSNRATYLDDLDRALELITGHFHGAWFIDHLQSGDAALLEGFTALTYMAAPSVARVWPLGAVPILPQPRARRQNGRDAAAPERRTIHPWPGRGVERSGVSRLRLRFPARWRPGRAARRGGPDHQGVVDPRTIHLRRQAL